MNLLSNLRNSGRFKVTSILLMLCTGPAFAAQQYEIINLTEAFDEGQFVPADINDAGEIPGSAYDLTNNSISKAYLYQNGNFVYLESDESVLTDEETLEIKTFPVAINNVGQTFGGATIWFENQYYSGGNATQYIWENGLRYTTGYGEYVYSNDDCYAIDINDLGNYLVKCDAAGYSNSTIYVNGNTYIDLYVEGTDIWPSAINNQNVIVGSYLGTAFRLENEVIEPLPNLGQARSTASDINDQGQIVGTAFAPAVQATVEKFAFLASPGGYATQLPSAESAEGKAINERGQIVGQLLNDLSDPTDDKAFLFTDGSVHNINDLVINKPSSMTLTNAWGINASGQIIGGGKLNNENFYYLATPISDACPGEYRKYNLNGQNSQWTRFVADIPACATHLNIEIMGGVGERDLYLRHTNPPWKQLHDCKRQSPIPNSDNHKRCQISDPAPGIWHIGVLRKGNYEGTTLRVRYW